MTSYSGLARSVQLNPSVTIPYTCGVTPFTGSRPSTRTIVPIPTGESSAVQKWNSCGVLGRRSVATTRPRGDDIGFDDSGFNCCSSVYDEPPFSPHRSQELLTIPN